uniref:Uncharacterized protein n=1 Tax=Ditylenchus dipsaci TaxID=166011 RepID=A0A915D4N4_9BILA
MQSGTYVPECQPSTSSANQFGHAGKQQGWMGGVQGMEMAGGMAVSHQQYGQASGYRIVQREDGQQIAYVDQQQEMLTEMGGQYVNAAAQNEGGYYNPVQPPPQLMSNGPDMLSNPNNASNQARRMPAPKPAAKKSGSARQHHKLDHFLICLSHFGSVMEKIFANTGDMNAAVSLMAEQEATGMDLSMQIKSVEEESAEPTSQHHHGSTLPIHSSAKPCTTPIHPTQPLQTTRQKQVEEKPPQAKQDPPPTTPTPPSLLMLLQGNKK